MKILLIDDSTLSRNMFKNAVGDRATYIEAIDGISGIEKFFLEKPDLVVLDLIMPGMNGMDVLARLKEIDPGVKVVIGTADVQEESQRMVMELGALGFITKPFTADTIKGELTRLLGEIENPQDDGNEE
jgi:two-component system, chemotaxis family, chemotaxis protein CheY